MPRPTRTEAGASILCAAVALTAVGRPAAHAQPAPPPAAEAEVWIRGETSATARVRETVDELLGRNGVAVVWRSEGAFRPEALFEVPAPRAEADGAAATVRPAARIWIDVGAEVEARLYLGDGAARRFVIRRLALPRGLDEVGREEIGHIVEAAVVTLVSGAEGTLSRTEAQAVLATLPPPPPAAASVSASSAAPAGGPRAGGAPPALEMSAIAAAGLYGGDPTITGRFGLALAVLSARSGLGAFGALDIALPSSHAGPPIAVALETQSLRAGLVWERRWGGATASGDPRWSLRGGVGGGVDRVTFRPSGDPQAVMPAPGGVFWAPAVRAEVVLGVGVWRGLRLLFGIPCDFTLADVHYDIIDEAGTRQRYFVPFRIRPALSAGLGWRF
jgi:hypothetical protein